MVYSALHITVPTRRDQKVTLRPGNRRDLSELSEDRSDTQVLFSQWCGTTVCLFVCVLGSILGAVGGGGYIVLFGPPCCMRITSRSLSLYPLLCPLTQHKQTHSHGLLPFNSQLGIRKLERWGELHKENTNVKKKTGTCIAISRHQNLSFK